MKEISESQLIELLATLNGSLNIRESAAQIEAAGVQDEWLAHCLLYENTASVWAAWRAATQR